MVSDGLRHRARLSPTCLQIGSSSGLLPKSKRFRAEAVMQHMMQVVPSSSMSPSDVVGSKRPRIPDPVEPQDRRKPFAFRRVG